MEDSDLGKVETVNVRERWPYEDDLTRELAENLDLLGDALGMKLQSVQMEKQVGPFYLDILAQRADTGVKVAIGKPVGMD